MEVFFKNWEGSIPQSVVIATVKTSGISFNISQFVDKMYFLSFHSCNCDVISPSFVYQYGGLNLASFSDLKANILRSRSDIGKRSTALFRVFPGRLTHRGF